MKVTGQEIIQHFLDCCEKYHKLFIPDSPRQEAVADSLAKFYDSELLISAIELFIKSKNGPFLVFDFAIESKTFTDRVSFEKKSSSKFQDIFEETRKRMTE